MIKKLNTITHGRILEIKVEDDDEDDEDKKEEKKKEFVDEINPRNTVLSATEFDIFNKE